MADGFARVCVSLWIFVSDYGRGRGAREERTAARDRARGGRRDADEARRSGGVVPINQIDWCDVERSQSPSPSSLLSFLSLLLALSLFVSLCVSLSLSFSPNLYIHPDRTTVHIQRVQSQIPLIRSLQYKFNPN